LGANPDIVARILKDAVDDTLGKSVVDGVIGKLVLLGVAIEPQRNAENKNGGNSFHPSNTLSNSKKAFLFT
jgi:hypothetical protein